MLPRALLLSGLLLASAPACGPAPHAGSGALPTASSRSASQLLPQLSIPPSPESLDAMRALEVMGDAGDIEAAWHRTHYLLDLFDAARFGHDVASRDLLGEIAGRPKSAMQGPAATQAIAELIVLEADRVLELDRQHVLGLQARVLASYDAVGPGERGQVAQAMQELKSVRRKQGPLASNATLRLFGYCRSALTDASSFARRGQRIALSHCLYPLFESDPEPYFAEASVLRPPPPTIGRLLEKQGELLESTDAGRLEVAIRSQRDWLSEFAKAPKLAPNLDPLALRLAPADTADPYDDFPLVTTATDDGPQLASRLLADGRHTLAAALASEASGADLLKVASLSASAGADSLVLLVATEQTLRVPRGDYWSDEMTGETALRVGQIPMSLALMDIADASRHGRATEAKATAWNRRQAQLTLHLIVAPQHWTLASPEGHLARIAIGDVAASPASGLRVLLTQIQKAYPDEQGLVLAPEAGVSVGALALAAQAASHNDQGQPLFSQLALASSAPKARPGKALLARVGRRAAAQVTVEPVALASKASSVLRCYQSLADARKAPVGEVRLELRPDGAVVAQGAAKPLQACAQGAFAEAMKADRLGAVRVVFSAKAK